MRQSVNLQLFNYLYTKFEELGVPIIRTSELNQVLPYPFIAIQSIRDDIHRLTFDSYSGSLLQLSIFGVQKMIKVRMMSYTFEFNLSY